MSLMELAQDYRRAAAVLKERIRKLETEETADGALAWRRKTLKAMYRETTELAVLCERYYIRGYRRNAKYTI